MSSDLKEERGRGKTRADFISHGSATLASTRIRLYNARTLNEGELYSRPDIPVSWENGRNLFLRLLAD